MIPIFQPSPTLVTKECKVRLEDAFAIILQNCIETDFSRLYDSLKNLRDFEPQFYQSLRSHHLTKAIFDIVDAEDKFRCGRSMQERLAQNGR